MAFLFFHAFSLSSPHTSHVIATCLPRVRNLPKPMSCPEWWGLNNNKNKPLPRYITHSHCHNYGIWNKRTITTSERSHGGNGGGRHGRHEHPGQGTGEYRYTRDKNQVAGMPAVVKQRAEGSLFGVEGKQIICMA